ncbi:uncharacterized protein FFMR_06974 [Fusarium fujikuroi]|nr:uncharacterized protein FFMR_06974 [Fusarium fujikuroi]
MATFPQFAKLPIELRDMIWEQALKKDRVLSMHVWTLGEDCWSAGRTMQLLHGRPEIPDAINSPTTPDLLTDERRNKLFRVNAESRQAAKRFYRVHIPCTYMKPGLYEKGTLYLRPELDTIRRGLTEGFGRLAHCVWAMDRLHIGLVNLAPDLQVKFSGFNGLAWKHDYFPKDVVEGELWKDGLRRLQNVSFQDTIPGFLDPRWADLRVSYLPLTPIHRSTPGYQNQWARVNKTCYLPTEGMRVSATFWFRLLAREGITLSQEVNYGCMLSQRDKLHQCLPNRTEKCQCAGELFIQDLRAKGTEVVPGYWLLSMDYLVFMKNDKGELKSNRYNPILEELSVLFELCIRQLTAYKEQTGIVDCRRRHPWKTS